MILAVLVVVLVLLLGASIVSRVMGLILASVAIINSFIMKNKEID